MAHSIILLVLCSVPIVLMTNIIQSTIYPGGYTFCPDLHCYFGFVITTSPASKCSINIDKIAFTQETSYVKIKEIYAA